MGRVDVVLGKASALGEGRRIEAGAGAGGEDLQGLVGVAYSGFHLDRENRLYVDRIRNERLHSADVGVANSRVLRVGLLLFGDDERGRLRIRREEILDGPARRVA